MSLIEINRHPTDKELRNFGIIALVFSFVISLLLYVVKGLGIEWAVIPFAVGFIIFLVSLISVKLARIFYLGLIFITLPIGWVVSFLLLAVFYFLIITPVGLIFRLIGRDLLCRRFDSNAKSYWLSRGHPDDNERYFRQF